MDAAFVLLAHEGPEIRTNCSLIQVGLLQLQRDWSLCSLCFSRDLTAGDRRYADNESITSNTNVSFKQLCSPATAVTGPWNCVLYRGILLLKAHSCSRRFSSNYVGDVAPKHSSGCGFVLTNLRHNSARGSICAMCTSSTYVMRYEHVQNAFVGLTYWAGVVTTTKVQLEVWRLREWSTNEWLEALIGVVDKWVARGGSLALSGMVDKWVARGESPALNGVVDKWVSRGGSLALNGMVDKWVARGGSPALKGVVDKWVARGGHLVLKGVVVTGVARDGDLALQVVGRGRGLALEGVGVRSGEPVLNGVVNKWVARGGDPVLKRAVGTGVTRIGE